MASLSAQLMMRAIIDWADNDAKMFGASAAEDYQYNVGDDPYENKNNYYDTVEELRLVKGVGDDFMAAFGDAFTVYGGCKVNVNLASVPVLIGLIVQHATEDSQHALQPENLILLARLLKHARSFLGGFTNVNTFKEMVQDPAKAALTPMGSGEGNGELRLRLPSLQKVTLKDDIEEAIVVGGPRRVWRIKATASVGRVRRKITSVWDMNARSSEGVRYNMGPGGFLYWREE